MHTNLVSDKTTGQVTKITGEFTLSLSASDVQEIKDNPDTFKAVFATGLAKTLGVNADDVTVTQIWINDVPQLRRLESDRRLNDAASVRVAYQILTTDTSVTVTADSIDAATLKANIQSEAAVSGITINVTVTDIAAPTTS